jgi:hypothetical protein
MTRSSGDAYQRRFDELAATSVDVHGEAAFVMRSSPGSVLDALVAGCARHVAPYGSLIAGFQLGRGYVLDSYDTDCRAAGLALTERFSTWTADPWRPGDEYAVSVHHFADR